MSNDDFLQVSTSTALVTSACIAIFVLILCCLARYNQERMAKQLRLQGSNTNRLLAVGFPPNNHQPHRTIGGNYPRTLQRQGILRNSYGPGVVHGLRTQATVPTVSATFYGHITSTVHGLQQIETPPPSYESVVTLFHGPLPSRAGTCQIIKTLTYFS